MRQTDSGPGSTLRHADGRPVLKGDSVTDFRGDVATISSIEAPRHAGSTGRVYVVTAEGHSCGYFPGVFGLAWGGQ